MIDRVAERFGLKPKRLAGDTAYGAAPMLAWLVKERDIEPHIPVFDKSRPIVRQVMSVSKPFTV